MKKFIILLLGLFSGTVFAGQNFDYELIRTKEVPGFFMAKIFAKNYTKPIEKKELYIKNYDKSEDKIYREIFPFLQQQRQARLIEGKEFKPEKVNPRKHIVIVLGEPLEGYLNFKVKEKEGDIFEQFQNFAEKNLAPILLDNLKVEFGGNVFDVQTKQDRITVNSPAIFIGKFKKDIPTRMKISGDLLESKFETETFLDLQNKKFAENELSEYLPELWNELTNKNKQNFAKKTTFMEKLNWGRILFYVFVFLIVLFLIALMRYVFRDENDEKYLFLHEEEVPIFHSEIPEKEYLEHEKNINDDELPFEVVWKQKINE